MVIGVTDERKDLKGIREVTGPHTEVHTHLQEGGLKIEKQ